MDDFLRLSQRSVIQPEVDMVLRKVKQKGLTLCRLRVEESESSIEALWWEKAIHNILQNYEIIFR